MIVLDTHIWFWWVNGDHARLTPTQTQSMRSAPEVGVSAVSCFEMAHAVKRGRIILAMAIREWFDKALAGSGIALLPLTAAVAARAVELSDHHRDPFDRIIIATVLELDGQLASADSQFPGYPELAGRLLA